MNNINHANHNNNINNGSNDATNATTPTTTITLPTTTTTPTTISLITIATATTATTTTMTNNIGSVSSNNNTLHNNNKNNNNNQTTLQTNNTTPNTLTTPAAPDAAAAVNLDGKVIASAADTGAVNKPDAHVADSDANDSSESAANDTDSDNNTDNDNNDVDNCDKFMTKGNSKPKLKGGCQNVDANRDKDLSESANKEKTKTHATSTKTNAIRQHCQQQQQQTATTKTATSMTVAQSSSAPHEQNETNSKSTNESISDSSNNKNKCKSNSTSTSIGDGSNGSGNGKAYSNYTPEHNLTNNIDYNKYNASGKQLHLNITEPHTHTITDDKLLNTRTHQKLRHSQRRLRTKALLDSLPQRLRTLAGTEQRVEATNSAITCDELLAGSSELLQKMSINNPFYRFRKQSTSLKEMRAEACAERSLRKARSDTDIFSWQLTNENQAPKSEGMTSVVHERFARAMFGGMGNGRARMGRGALYNAPQKHGETAVQLTAIDGSVVVVLDSKHPSVVSKPKSLSSLEELLDASIANDGHGSRGFMLDAVAAERAFADTTTETDSSTVITNPFSIFHDDDVLMLNVDARLRAASSASQQQRSLKKRQRSERSIRRLCDAGIDAASTKRAPVNYQTGISARQHYLNGIPVSRFERQDFVSTAAAMTLREATKSHKLKPKLVFKNLSLRKIHKSASGLPATSHTITTNTSDAVGNLNALPQMKKLKISYPNRTQSIHSALDVSSSAQLSVGLVSPGGASGATKHSYFERLQAKTRQGLQKLRDKCRNFKQAAGHHQHTGTSRGFSTLAKDDSFRFIGDRARISSYESKCAALNGSNGRQQATIYKSYKSEIDLSKNLHYLDAYLEENFDQQLRSTKQSANSVGRVSASRLQRQKLLDGGETQQSGELPKYAKVQGGRAHKRSFSAAQKQTTITEQRAAALATTTNNYENVGTLPIARRGCSDSLSSSDYASVFSGPTLAVEPATPSSVGATETITPSLMDDASSSAGLRYEHPKMSQYFFNKLDLEGSADLLLAAQAGHGSIEAASGFFNTCSEDDLVDEDSEFGEAGGGGGAGGDAALLVDYRRAANMDDGIRILVNEVEDTDFQQELERQLASTKQRRTTNATTDWYQQQHPPNLDSTDERNFLLGYNENLAESHFYRSLNQHLQQQQKQRQRDLYFDVNADLDEHDDDDEEENGIGAAIANGLVSEGDADKDIHYESYLEHFYRARSGHQTRKANSIGYDDERVEDDAEGGYVTRSAFRRTARGRKAGGSAFELRHSALLLLGEHLNKNTDRNKEAVDMASDNSRAAYYARQFYGFGGDIDVIAAEEAGTSGADVDRIKLPASTNKLPALTPLSGNLAVKGRQHDTTAAFAREPSERFKATTQSRVDATANLLATTTGTNIAPDEFNTAYQSSPAEAALLREKFAIPSTHYMSTSTKDNIDAARVYNEGATKNYTAALTTISARHLPVAATTPTNLLHQTSGNARASAYLQQQQRDRQQHQQQLQLTPAPAASSAALFIEGSKHSGKSGHHMEALSSSANNRYMLDNMRRHYQQQQKQHQQQKSTNSVSSSLSLSTSSSSNSSVSQPVAYNQQQPLLLPTNTANTHTKYIQPQQQQLPPLATYHTRRSSTASNASSSDNFDSFIAVRSAQTPSGGAELASPVAIAALQPDYAVSTKLSSSNNSAGVYQQRQQLLANAHTRAQTAAHYPTSPSSGGSSSTVPLINALNYYGTGGGGGSGISDSAHPTYASSTASASASASASSSSSSSSTNHRYALTANASAVASNNYALLAQMHYGNKGSGTNSVAIAADAAKADSANPLISPSYASERKPFILEYEC
ncbi:PREDICTED: uncharacterized protein LOC108367492 [Rhagoletis zephyria]|uniref:uncharacterized protein LOC108367492 n=1 Tax=Rhagoletis zephyria TaxID=28612 RepID=UPI000811685D|nr:PREDICTED: uncharacterized protein LOC108367492 [Rhagoletis zephyria]